MLLGLKAFFAVVIMVSDPCVRFINVSWRAFEYRLLSAGWACLSGMFSVRVVTLAMVHASGLSEVSHVGSR